ncbi:MAG TPA: cobyrinate a,c-diamide synthase [Chitinophaga sp.]|uniref:cobyrinate a,c-diamide synthase n=1 Tax=Chitinophaga sp. TaxID=1869181 RepID=UPI002C82815F|nr:cobyrinate a,c-diamide synthase [Chitinophaga sp.]HVI45270.1 cobyrinate a,c-diamide synthase [Chitinophaga sp.]
MKPQFLIAAPHSGAGKTTVTLGLLRSLQRKGLKVQPFKCGPDYIDPMHHTIAAGRPGINLDRFMMSDAHVQELYKRNIADAGAGIIEGVMGLFDGSVKMEGSSAALAAFLDVPVILVVNAKAMAYSAAALLYGYKHFFKEITIAGVIFNFVNTPSHYRILREAAADIGITALGYLPVQDDIHIPSRHLGLHMPEDSGYEAVIDRAADHLEKHIDLDLLLQLTLRPVREVSTSLPQTHRGKLRVGVAYDAAFNFIYPENVRAIASEVKYFSPLKDTVLPDVDLLYFPGGYPELHLPALSANTAMLQQLQQYSGKILAECGGMMYLGEAITDESGQTFTMAGLLPVRTSMQHKKLSLGYRQVYIDNILLKGHEFHYSRYEKAPVIASADIRVLNARGETLDSPVFRTNNILAGYMHFYFGDNADSLLDCLFV